VKFRSEYRKVRCGKADIQRAGMNLSAAQAELLPIHPSDSRRMLTRLPVYWFSKFDALASEQFGDMTAYTQVLSATLLFAATAHSLYQAF